MAEKLKVRLLGVEQLVADLDSLAQAAKVEKLVRERREWLSREWLHD